MFNKKTKEKEVQLLITLDCIIARLENLEKKFENKFKETHKLCPNDCRRPRFMPGNGNYIERVRLEKIKGWQICPSCGYVEPADWREESEINKVTFRDMQREVYTLLNNRMLEKSQEETD